MSWQMTTPPKKQFGGLPPQYNFVLNPYPEVQVSRCPFCDRKTGQRKVPLFIHVDPLTPLPSTTPVATVAIVICHRS
jgi:hypothetical protein